MDVLTLYVGQGAMAVARHGGESIVIDSHFPGSPDGLQDSVEGKLDLILNGQVVSGLILTGFDSDHCCPEGVELVLSKCGPDWVMYPTYYKDTDCATEVFRIIDEHIERRRKTLRPLRRISVRLDSLGERALTGLSNNFEFELFSPDAEDSDHSNNSSLVLKMTGVGDSGFTYLITGDTESVRWDRINTLFGSALKSDVLAAPHHGSRTGANAKSILLIEPNTVLISAGVDSQYEHPHNEAIHAYSRVAKHVFATNIEGGVSLFTKRSGDDFQTLLVR
jgi:beta-lactamase superfamily II metal-dependent hydrolase